MLTTPEPVQTGFPFPEPPAPGTLLEVAPGVLWARFSLPFLLNHVNVFLVEDNGGWAVFDTGIGLDDTKAAWEQILAGPLRGTKITRIVCSHYHPDHLGLVGWLTDRFACPLSMSRTEYLMTLVLQNRAFASNQHFYAERGLAGDAAAKVATGGHGYLRLVTGLPTQFDRLTAGETLRIGGRDFEIFTGGGHSPEQAMLLCRANRLFFAADQVLTKISPNISVHALEPEADPLGDYLASLAQLHDVIPGDVLTLPGHHVPFTGLHGRLAELAQHHASRCDLIADSCRTEPRTAGELLPVIFKRDMDPHQTGFAFGEVVAHVNYMRKRGELTQERGDDGILWVRAA